MQDATAVDTEEVNRLTTIAQQRAAEREALAQEERELALQQQQLTQMRDALTARVQSDQMALDTLGGVPVMGASRLTGAQITAWFNATGHQATLDGATSIASLAQMFIEEGAAEGVRGDVAFAQSIIETGYFRETCGNNYAGVGNCDSCGGRGYFFRDATRRCSCSDPAATELRRPVQPRREPRVPTRAGVVRQRSGRRRGQVRHVLPQGEGAALEPDGPRQVGDGPDVRGAGSHGVPAHAHVRGHALVTRVVQLMNTGVPMGIRCASSLIVSFGSRTHPCEAAWPMVLGTSVP